MRRTVRREAMKPDGDGVLRRDYLVRLGDRVRRGGARLAITVVILRITLTSWHTVRGSA
jgi:hypothetical protein